MFLESKNDNFFFLLGAGRSGTTLLYKMLSAHHEITYLSNYLNFFPEWPSLAYLQRLLNKFPEYKRKAWFNEKGGAYFNESRKSPISFIPYPSECESVYSNCGIPFNPTEDYRLLLHTANCLRQRFESVLDISGAQVLLSKRTANNRRISVLNQIFPNAKYIHLIRDGRAVAHSLLQVKWWDDHILYWAGKSPKQMIAQGADPIELAAQNWVEEMCSLEHGIALIEKNQLLEVKYEELLKDPYGQLRHILDFMGVNPQADEAFWGIIEFLQLRPREEAWNHNWTEQEMNKVLTVQQATLKRWGFIF